MRGNTTILLCDENEVVHRVLELYFQQCNIQTISAYDCCSAWKLFQSNSVNLVILDVAMQGMAGKDLCIKIRKYSDTPILILSVYADENDRIAGFELGADDYVTKPFSPKEVVARGKGILRRCEAQQDNPTMELGNIRINAGTREVFIGEEPLRLTPKETTVLIFLIKHAGEVVSREKIRKEAWGNDQDINICAVDTILARIRTKIPSTIANVTFRCVYGVGYMIAGNDDKFGSDYERRGVKEERGGKKMFKKSKEELL